MSNSYRKTPISGITIAESEKQDKNLANRKERRIIRQILAYSPEDGVFPQKREIINVWDMSKDGKRWFDPTKYPKFMWK